MFVQLVLLASQPTLLFQVAFDKNFVAGFSFIHKPHSAVTLTLSSQINTADLSGSKHSLGAALTFDF